MPMLNQSAQRVPQWDSDSAGSFSSLYEGVYAGMERFNLPDQAPQAPIEIPLDIQQENVDRQERFENSERRTAREKKIIRDPLKRGPIPIRLGRKDRRVKDMRGLTRDERGVIDMQRQHEAIMRRAGLSKQTTGSSRTRPARRILDEKGSCGGVPRVGKVGDIKLAGGSISQVRIPNADLKKYALMGLAGFVIYTVMK